MKTCKTVSWFSAGVSSAVATKLIIDEIDEIIYTHIDDQHPDTMRFVKDCEEWFGKKITILQSHYKNVETAIMCVNRTEKKDVIYVNGPHGASCTAYLKRRVRMEWECDNNQIPLVYVWGMDCNESERLARLFSSMPKQNHRAPLIEKSISKEHAHQILKASGIKRPAMYDLGYHNNNCVGCVKGGMGYWNKIRVDFPEVFKQRAAMERKARGTCLNGIYLDELDPERGRHDGPICEDCGIFCELDALR